MGKTKGATKKTTTTKKSATKAATWKDVNATATTGAVDVDVQQPALIPMSDKEVKDAGRKLAGIVRELKDLTTQHQGLRAEMKKERTALREEMEAVAQCIRQQGR